MGKACHQLALLQPLYALADPHDPPGELVTEDQRRPRPRELADRDQVVPVAEPSGLYAEEGGPRRNFGRFRQVCQLWSSSDLPEEDSAQLARIRKRSEISSQRYAHTL